MSRVIEAERRQKKTKKTIAGRSEGNFIPAMFGTEIYESSIICCLIRRSLSISGPVNLGICFVQGPLSLDYDQARFELSLIDAQNHTIRRVDSDRLDTTLVAFIIVVVII